MGGGGLQTRHNEGENVSHKVGEGARAEKWDERG